jgi:hypothetical protein
MEHNVQDLVHKSLPLASILSQKPTLRFILILSSYLCLLRPIGLLASDFPNKTVYAFLMYPVCAIFQAHLIVTGEEYNLGSSEFLSSVQSPVPS